MNEILTIIMAGGEGLRLHPLTQNRCKAAVPFGGKFRLIDFTLSNCLNSGLRQIYILTQYCSGSLQRHIQNWWGISSPGPGDFIHCIPPDPKMGIDSYHGTADAVRKNLNLIANKDVEDVIILSCDHVYKMNYRQFIEQHRNQGADLTISASREKKEQAAGNVGVLEVDLSLRLIGFEEKPLQPKTLTWAPDYALASMGVYIFKATALLEVLRRQGDDFGKQVIPGIMGSHYNIDIYDYTQQNKIGAATGIAGDSSYWKDVGTLDSYFKASMDLLGTDPVFRPDADKWPILAYPGPFPPGQCILGGTTVDSIISDGCIISGGTVLNSILSPGVIVARGALIEQSILFNDVVVGPGARIRRAIIDKESRIRDGDSIGYDREADLRRGCIISDGGIVVVSKGTDLGSSEPTFLRPRRTTVSV